MAARKVDAPSCSKDASPSPCTYHVFLSFRGETRKSFTDFLHEALERAGFRAFRDDDNIQRGKSIEAEIRRGIQESQLSIIVLSKGYASSEWCLEELVMIMERQRNGRCVVLPVFYDVDPDKVLDLNHSYAEALARHQEKFEEDRVEGWKKALSDVAELAGMVLGDRHQVPFVQEIVKTVKKVFESKEQHVYRDKWEQFGAVAEEEPTELVAKLPCDGTIGTEAKFNEIWKGLEEKDIGIIGLNGIGGVSKTTLLTQIRNTLVELFNNLLVIWIVVGKNSNFAKVQTYIGREIRILQGSIDEKRIYIYNKLRKKRFVLLLDDI